MTLTANTIDRIKAAAYPDVKDGSAEKRITAVYSSIMEHVKPADEEAVIEEIIEWEKVWAGGNHDLSEYEKISDETRLWDYSRIASYFAHKKLESPDAVFMLPYYASKAFVLFSINSRESLFWHGHALLASDTGIDLLFAAGKTKCLSMRLWEKIR